MNRFKKLGLGSWVLGLVVALIASSQPQAPVRAADLTITTANVKPLAATTKIKNIQLGETVTPGQPVYLKVSDQQYYLADNDVDEESATVAGIMITGGVDNGYGVMCYAGEMDLGATLDPGDQYLLSSTAGGICEQDDPGSSDWITSLGVSVATGKFIVNIKTTDYQVP
jgi:hypothetical protein